MTDVTFSWPLRRPDGTADETATRPLPQGVSGDWDETVSAPAAEGVSGPGGDGVSGDLPEGVSGDEEILSVGEWTVADEAGQPRRELPASVIAALSAAGSWAAAAAGSDILGGGPGGLSERILNPDPAELRGHYSTIANHPWKPGNEYLAFLFTGIGLLATVPLKITGKTARGIGAIGKGIDLAGDNPATIAVIAVTATAMILAVIFT